MTPEKLILAISIAFGYFLLFHTWLESLSRNIRLK
jgi:hypothetical protein